MSEEKEVKVALELLESLRQKLNESIGRKKLLEQQLASEFKIKPTKKAIQQKLKDLKSGKARARKEADKRLVEFRKEWRRCFGDDKCPL